MFCREFKAASFSVLAALVIVFLVPASLLGSEPARVCERVNTKDLSQALKRWQGRELIGFASWCSSCKEKLLSTKANPDKFLFVSVFEDPKTSVAAMDRLGLSSPCIFGEGIDTALGIKSLPWSKKI